MRELLFDSDDMSDEEINQHLSKMVVQKQRWLASFHPDSRIRRMALIKSGVRVGKGTRFSIGLVVLDGYESIVSIGQRCAFGNNVSLIAYSSPNESLIEGRVKKAPITIKDDAWIGAGVIILPGVTIGEKAIVGAGTIVTKDVSDNTTVTGVV